MKSIFTGNAANLFEKNSDSIVLINDDCLNALKKINSKSIDMVFADPPYFLSNGGISCKSGKIVSVDKGDWDKAPSPNKIDEFNFAWISQCRRVLADNGTIWISGTFHNIFSVGTILDRLNFKILNMVVWQKEDPPPNMSHRMFTHSHEFIIWAKKSPQSKQFFDYNSMLIQNNGKQMTDVWTLPHVPQIEKKFGYHPTQKPLKLLDRIIIASTKPDDIILDPFCGSGTTGVSAKSLNRKFIGVEKEKNYFLLAKRRLGI